MHFGAFYALIALKIRKIVLTSAFFIWTWRNLVHMWSTPIPKGHMILVAMVTNFAGNIGCHGYQISRYTQIAMAKIRGKIYTYVWYIIGKRRPLAIESWLYNFSIYPSSKVIMHFCYNIQLTKNIQPLISQALGMISKLYSQP